jgi:alcohol dehydrogenase (cytochrome c)
VHLGERRKVLSGIPGKTGIIYTLDRATGEFLWARPTVSQNVVKAIDPATGGVIINEDLMARPFEDKFVCPSLAGGKNWQAGAYSPLTRLMYQPLQNMCMTLTGNVAEPKPSDGYATSWVILEDPAVKTRPYPVGRVDAYSLETGKSAWHYEQRAGMTGALMATAGRLVFGGDVNRRFKALNDTTGKVLWETILSGPVSGHPISYEVDGIQYVAISAGGDTFPDKSVLSLHPEIQPTMGMNALFVFKVPGVAGKPTTETARRR